MMGEATVPPGRLGSGAGGPTRGARRQARRTLPALTVLMAGILLLAGCGADHDQGLDRVRALGVDPADGALYATGPNGVFRIRPGKPPQRVGESTRDVTGFVIVGPGHFLAGGPPASDEEDSPSLGLIESTDAGVTWRQAALAGKATFRALEVKHGLTFGYDSQNRQLMVSSDRKTWERRARLRLTDLAVSPDDPQVLLATTADGLVAGTDGGRSFVPVDGAPALQLVDWPTADTVIGVSPTGIVGSSPDRGATWFKMGTVSGTPTALTTNGPQEVYVATDGGIHVSKDGGRTFSRLHDLTQDKP